MRFKNGGWIFLAGLVASSATAPVAGTGTVAVSRIPAPKRP